MPLDDGDAGLRKAKAVLLWWGVGCVVSVILAAALIAAGFYIYRQMTDSASDMAPANIRL